MFKWPILLQFVFDLIARHITLFGSLANLPLFFQVKEEFMCLQNEWPWNSQYIKKRIEGKKSFNHDGGPSVPPKYTVGICTSIPPPHPPPPLPPQKIIRKNKILSITLHVWQASDWQLFGITGFISTFCLLIY